MGFYIMLHQIAPKYFFGKATTDFYLEVLGKNNFHLIFAYGENLIFTDQKGNTLDLILPYWFDGTEQTIYSVNVIDTLYMDSNLRHPDY